MWEAAEININAIPTKVLENYAELFQNAKKINYLRFKLFTKNASDWHGSFFDELLLQMYMRRLLLKSRMKMGILRSL